MLKLHTFIPISDHTMNIDIQKDQYQTLEIHSG